MEFVVCFVYIVLTPKNVIVFHLKLLLDNSASFTSSRMKVLCQKWKVKLIFWGLKQSDGLTWPTLSQWCRSVVKYGDILQQIYITGSNQQENSPTSPRLSRICWPSLGIPSFPGQWEPCSSRHN